MLVLNVGQIVATLSPSPTGEERQFSRMTGLLFIMYSAVKYSLVTLHSSRYICNDEADGRDGDDDDGDDDDGDDGMMMMVMMMMVMMIMRVD